MSGSTGDCSSRHGARPSGGSSKLKPSNIQKLASIGKEGKETHITGVIIDPWPVSNRPEEAKASGAPGWLWPVESRAIMSY